VEWLHRSWPTLVGFLLAPATLIALTVFSLVACVVSLLCASWAVRRLPVDYLLSDHVLDRPRSATGVLLRVLRNGVGVLLLILGLLMLVLPGQGVLTILAGLSLMDFRGKRRLECRLMLSPRVFALINRFRSRAGQPRLLSPGPSLSDGPRPPGPS
jgi:hypothetical protein